MTFSPFLLQIFRFENRITCRFFLGFSPLYILIY